MHLGGASDEEPTSQCRRHKWHWFDFWVRKIPWKRDGYPLQYSCLRNPMDWGAWKAIVHRVTRSWTWLKWLSLHALTKYHSSVQPTLNMLTYISLVGHNHLTHSLLYYILSKISCKLLLYWMWRTEWLSGYRIVVSVWMVDPRDSTADESRDLLSLPSIMRILKYC